MSNYESAALNGYGDFYDDAAMEGYGDFYDTAAMDGYGDFYNTAALHGYGMSGGKKLIKGSTAAKRYMAFLRSLRGRRSKTRKSMKKAKGGLILSGILGAIAIKKAIDAAKARKALAAAQNGKGQFDNIIDKSKMIGIDMRKIHGLDMNIQERLKEKLKEIEAKRKAAQSGGMTINKEQFLNKWGIDPSREKKIKSFITRFKKAAQSGGAKMQKPPGFELYGISR